MQEHTQYLPTYLVCHMNLLGKWQLFNILVAGTGDRKIGGNMK